MTKRSSLPYAALVVTLFTLVATFGGAAVAAKTIGKNLVVTKSIKNGAVTADKIAVGAVDGSKVKDGSLTAADLAAGTIPTIPAPTNGKVPVFGSTPLGNAGAGFKQLFTAAGAGGMVGATP